MLLHAGATSEIPSNVSVAALLRESVALLSPSLAPKLNVTLEIVDREVFVSAVPAELQGIVLNLAINGAHAIEGRGELSVRLRSVGLRDTGRPAGTESLAPCDYAVIEVRDDGAGIERRHLDKIFDPFFTTKRRGQGTGLGLSNAIATARRVGGTITVKSVVGVGSAFSVWLPRTKHEAKITAPLSSASAVRFAQQPRVVIIDDEPLMRRVLGLAMKQHGISARTYSSGEDGVRAIRQAADEVDIVLLDLLMPGMSGLEVFRELQRLPDPPRTILMTGFAENEDVEQALEEGASAVVYKPFNLAEVIRLIHHTVDPERALATHGEASAATSHVSNSAVRSDFDQMN